MREFWPFILPLPAKPAEQYEVLASVFKSDIALSVLRELKVDGKTYQKEILRSLSSHSNKSVLKYLRRFVEAGILEEGMDRVEAEGRGVWVKWYKPTFIGRWLIVLLKPREEFSPSEISLMLQELIAYYAESISRICLNYGLKPERFKEIFDKHLK
ncbi:hypothetical protein J7L06_11045 [Candidatus Bathyarchaeota archaeon]|nr:hypothetical protein [Candidatus Bathyarchaeota archaeon]